MKFHCLVAVLALAFPMYSFADATGPLACAQPDASFDGSMPLSFSRVTGVTDTKLDIHPQYPDACTTGQSDCEPVHAYVIAGDDVAVGKQCGAWSYIQFIGASKITTGWVESDRLEPPRDVQNTEGYLRAAFGNGVPAGPLPPPFRMKKGRDTPVCEAYLQRLNTSDYTPLHASPIPPYAEIPESDAIPGFVSLHRIALTPDEIIRMSGPLARWWLSIDPRQAGDWDLTPNIAKSSAVAAWRYDPPLDIENDGKPVDLIVWRGAGLDAGAARCGEPFNQNYTYGYRCRQMPLVMKGDLQVDQARTAELFGRAGAAAPGSDTKRQIRHPFDPVGYFIAPFEYRGVAYFSAFFDRYGDYAGKRRGISALWNTLGVLRRDKGTTQEVCEYQMEGDDHPMKDVGLED